MKYKRELIFIIFLTITVFGVYWKTFNYELIWDSKIYFTQNILFEENRPITSAFKFGYFREQLGVEDVDFYYRPLLTASYILENKLWGLKNTSLRLTNLVIYILSLVFLYIFFRNQSETKSFPEITTLLFALYPLNVENIVWVLGRNDLFLLLWGSLTFLFLELFIKKRKTIYLFCSSFFYLLGIFSKEAFIFFLPILFVYEVIKRKKISIPYHAANIFISMTFFILKNSILGIKNLKFIFSSNIMENIKIAIGSLGYYFRSIIFPVKYDMFLPLEEVTNLFYFLFGILFILLCLFLLYLSKKEIEILIPFSFIVLFIGGHLLLSFTNLYPFKIYSRYMMIPALGFIWIFVKYISRLNWKIGNSLAFLIFLLFIPSIVINALSYRSELHFFQKARRSSPESSYIHFQIAKVYLERNNYLSAELYLNKALSYKPEKETAMLASLLHADIELRRAAYENVFRWLQNIEKFASSPDLELAPLMKFQIRHKKALVYIALGKTEYAEKLLKENIARYVNQRESYNLLYGMYIGYNLWEKAEDLEKIMKKRFASASVDTARLKDEFNSLSTEGKISFYIRYRNFHKAISTIKTLSPLDLSHKILLSKLYYGGGEEEEAKKTVDEILSENPDNFEVLNAIGNTYLKDLLRVKQALVYFKRSLELNNNQPEVAYLILNLTEMYQNKLNTIQLKE
jgi:tetratricopeptide (TPR) repeat protein